MLELLSGFIVELRSAGLPVSLTEHLDAAEALHHVPMEDREALKSALGATLVKSASHWASFEIAFEVYFAPRLPPVATGTGAEGAEGEEVEGPGDGGEGAKRSGGGGAEALTPEELAELVLRAIRTGDRALRNVAARHAVELYAAMEPGRPVGGTYYVYRTLRHLDLDGLYERLMAGERADAPLTPLEERLIADEYRARIQALRQAIEAEIRRRLVEDRGAEALAKSVRRALPEDIDVMHATRDEIAALQRTLRPLSRKLAVRLARKRRHQRRGPLDFRATVRHSLSTGGVPVEPRYKHPRPAKPEIGRASCRERVCHNV